ncbi:MAG TPA: helix-turn-helix transcriptional regulator [Candidatus Aminicenantes bacterium]|nr:helix-turn-helix transcriptional regulator [Candidatus Aminicenantes bacterium]
MSRAAAPDYRDTFDVIAANVKRIRGRKMMDQQALARAAGVARETVSRIETSKNFSVRSLVKIARALGIDPEDLFLTDEDRAEITYKQKRLWEKLNI